MNLPNKLTVFRVILIVPFVILLLGGHAQWGWFQAVFGGIADIADYIALGIFIIASLTDMLDGKIARKYNLVTNFGKFMDPLADKLLVCAALICLIELDRVPAWIVIIIISREFIISGFRLIAADNRVVIAANYWGKFKTTFSDDYGLSNDCEFGCFDSAHTDCDVDCVGIDGDIARGLYSTK